jgi:acid stress chaperone HdeB
MTRHVLIILGVFLGTALLPAAAQVNLDMNKITCKDLLGYDSVNRTFVMYWMSGYYSGSKNNDVLDFRRLQSNAEKVMTYCQKNKSDPLPKAINKSAS